MFKSILSLFKGSRRRGKDKAGRLYYLYGIKPIKASKSIIDECTVSRE